MGMDLALGAVVLIAAIRGWMRGFISQSVRLAGFVACFYLAGPVRDQARPHVLSRMPRIDPALMDRMLWWASAAASYVVVVGAATLLIKLARRPDPSGKAEARRDDQFAGFLLGGAKGALVAVFLLAGWQKYAEEIGGRVEWAARLTEGSKTLEWNKKYEPAPKIWEAPPVRRFVDHIRRNGLGKPPEPAPTETPDGQVAAVRTPSPLRVVPRLEIPEPKESVAEPVSSDFAPEVLADLERFKADREARRARRPEPDWR